MDAETQAGELGALEAILGDEVLFTDTQSQPYYIEVCVKLLNQRNLTKKWNLYPISHADVTRMYPGAQDQCHGRAQSGRTRSQRCRYDFSDYSIFFPFTLLSKRIPNLHDTTATHQTVSEEEPERSTLERSVSGRHWASSFPVKYLPPIKLSITFPPDYPSCSPPQV